MNPVMRSDKANSRSTCSGFVIHPNLMGGFNCPRPGCVVLSGHVSDSVSLESTRRRLTAKQADTIQRLSNAALAVLAREGFGGLTIRLVAAEAGVGGATASPYFSSKE